LLTVFNKSFFVYDNFLDDTPKYKKDELLARETLDEGGVKSTGFQLAGTMFQLLIWELSFSPSLLLRQ
jgi:hypothetical protein